MAALMRCKSLIYRNFVQSVSKILSVSTNSGVIQSHNQRYAATAAAAASKDVLLERIRHKTDLNVGISQELFQAVYSSCSGSLTEQDVSLLLHVCASGPFDSPTKRRSELADEVWNKMEQSGIKPTTKMYNIKLRVYISNKTRFSPVDELLKIKALGLNPDRVTYGMLLEEFCQQGDIAGANSVLEAFKTADLLLGIGMFNSFITGHLKAGSPEEAAKILDLMRSRGLTPDADSYFRFAIHYGEEGDIDSVVKYINMAQSEGVFLDFSALLELYKMMVTSGHSSKVEKLLKILSERGVYRNMTMQKTCQLACDGFSEAAFQLYTVMPKIENDRQENKKGSFILKAMIVSGQNAEDIANMADKIADTNFRSSPHSFALLFAYKAGNTDLAVQLLEIMKTRNLEMKVPHLIPAIVSYRKSQNKKGLYQVIRMLLELDGNNYIDDKVECLYTFAYPALTALGETREDIVKNFQDFEKSWNFVFFCKDLEKSYPDALSNAAEKTLDTSFFQWLDLDTHVVKHFERDWQSFIDVVIYLKQHGMKRDRVMSLCVLAVLQAAQKRDWSFVEQVLTELQDKNLKLWARIKKTRSYLEAPEQVKSIIDKLCVHDGPETPSRQYLSAEQLKSMTIEELEKYQKKRPDISMVKGILLSKILETNDLENIKSKLRELETIGYKLNFTVLVNLVKKLTELRDSETALQYFDELTKIVNTNYNVILPLSIGLGLVKAGKASDALKMIRAADKSTFPNRFDIGKVLTLKAMLDSAPTLSDAAMLHNEMFIAASLLHDKEPLQVHTSYIHRVLKEADDDELLDTLTKLHESYHVFPRMEQFLIRFIEKQDVTRLKKVMDIGLSVFGSNNFHLRLAMCFLRCGMPAKAATVLQTPKLHIQEKLLQKECQYLLKTKRVDCLESLVRITKDMPVSKAQMLKYLLEGYVAADDMTKATKVLEDFANSFLTLPKDTAEFLVKAYVSRNMPVPELLQEYQLESPSVNETSQTSSSDSDSESSTLETTEITSQDAAATATEK